MKKRLLILIALFGIMWCVFAQSNNAKDLSVVQTIDFSVLAHKTDDESAPIVYYTKDISAAGMLRLYEKLGWSPVGKTGVKISTGEPPASNYLRPSLLKDTVQKVNGTIVECNTAYGGSSTTRYLYSMSRQSGCIRWMCKLCLKYLERSYLTERLSL